MLGIQSPTEKNKHFEGFNFRLNLPKHSNAMHRSSKCSSSMCPNTITSSKSGIWVQFPQDVLDEMLKSHRSIAEPEGHMSELAKSQVSHGKSCILLGLRHNLCLPESALEIHH